MSTDSPSSSWPFQPAGVRRARPGIAPIPIGQVYLHVRQRRLLLLNETARRLRAEGVPFTARDLARQPLHTPEGAVVAAEQLPLVIAWRQGRAVEASYQLFRKGKSAARICWSASPQRDAQKRIVGVFGSVCVAPVEPDWPALAGLAHDLRTPLNALGLLATVLESPGLSQADLRDNLQDLRAAADRALRVGMDLLEWSRNNAFRGRPVELKWFPIEPCLDRLVREQAAAARRKGLTLASDLAAVQGWEVLTDQVRLGRLLANLLVNAIRYTRTGRVEFTAAWRDEPNDKRLVLGVVDTGSGILGEEQDSIFQPFERGQAGREEDSSGSGLGLTVVDQLAEELGLDLEVYSEFGRGSAFRLLMPPHLLRRVSAAGPVEVSRGEDHRP